LFRKRVDLQAQVLVISRYAGVSDKTRLTMGLYTHIGLHDQTRAIESLPPPPETNGGEGKTDAA
jgi:hypothetical protein